MLCRFVFCLALLLLFPAFLFAQKSGTVTDRGEYKLPSWSEAVKTTDVEKWYATQPEYEAAAADKRYKLEKVRYLSDGLEVVAYIYGPRSSRDARLPVIVFNRGSYVRGDIAAELLPMFHRLAGSGYLVVAPLYRGSDGGEGHDEMGGADLDDLMNIVPVLKRLGAADTRNVFLYGESRGGMMIFQAIRDGFPANAAATYGGFTDLEQMTSGPAGEAMANAIWPDFKKHREAIIERRSAVRWADKLKIPLLLMQGSDDGQVAPTQTLRLATELAKGTSEFGVFIFPGANHTIQQFRNERDRLAIEFFRRHLLR